MPTFYQIDSRNSSGKDPLYDITAIEIDEKYISEINPNTVFPSFGAAKKAIELNLMEKLHRTQATLAQILNNLEKLHTMYPAPVLLNELLGGKLDELEAGLKQLKTNKGSFKVGPLSIQNNYQDVPNLYVLSLPEYDTVNTTFDTKSMEMVMNTFKNVGIHISSQWNGQGYHSWSLRTEDQDTFSI